MLELISLSVRSCEYKILASLNNMMVGEISYTLFVFDIKTAVITDLEVPLEWQRKGIGTELFNKAITEILSNTNMDRVMVQDGSTSGATSRMAYKRGFRLSTPIDGKWLELRKKDFVVQHPTQEALK